MHSKHQKRQKEGITLISVIIGLLIIGVIGAASSSFISTSFKSLKRVSIIREREEVRNFIRMRTNCAATNFNSNSYLYNKNNQPIANAASNLMTVNGWTVTVNSHDSITGDYSIVASKPGHAAQELFKPVPLNCKPYTCFLDPPGVNTNVKLACLTVGGYHYVFQAALPNGKINVNSIDVTNPTGPWSGWSLLPGQVYYADTKIMVKKINAGTGIEVSTFMAGYGNTYKISGTCNVGACGWGGWSIK